MTAYSARLIRGVRPAPQASSRRQIQLTPSIGGKKQNFQTSPRPQASPRQFNPRRQRSPHLGGISPLAASTDGRLKML
jgi:hypothetical protein